MKPIFTASVLAAICVVIFFLGAYRSEPEDKPLLHVADEVALKVKVANPERRDIIRLVQAPGEVEAVLEVDISSEVLSKIEEMPIEEGDLVKKGDLLCRLDDDNVRAAIESGEARVARIQASIEQSEADLERAQRDFKRQIRLSEMNVNTVRELEDYRTELKRAKATVEMRRQELVEAHAVLKRTREDLKRTVIESPIDGIVSKLNAKQGEVVVTGTMNNPGTVIMTISDLSKMQVRARVDEVDIPLVRPDQKARIYLQADRDRPVPARVVRVAAKGSRPPGRDVVTFETLLEVVSNDPRIKPGMTANIEIEVDSSDEALTIPVEAVVHRLRKDLADPIVAEFDRMQADLDLSDRARQAQYIKVVYIVIDDVARLRLIKPGIADSKRVELLEGIGGQDSVIIGPYRSLDQLKDGRKIEIDKEEEKEGQKTQDEDSEAAEAVANGSDANADAATTGG